MMLYVTYSSPTDIMRRESDACSGEDDVRDELGISPAMARIGSRLHTSAGDEPMGTKEKKIWVLVAYLRLH